MPEHTDETLTLYGQHLHKIDVKRRISLPKIFTDNALLKKPDVAFIHVPAQNYVAIGSFNLIASQYALKYNRDEQTAKSTLAPFVQNFDPIDRSGRVLVPQHILQDIGFKEEDSQLMITGNNDHIRIYSVNGWKEKSMQFSL